MPPYIKYGLCYEMVIWLTLSHLNYSRGLCMSPGPPKQIVWPLHNDGIYRLVHLFVAKFESTGISQIKISLIKEAIFLNLDFYFGFTVPV